MHTFFSAQSIGQRSSQQDTLSHLAISARHSLYVLADGMGGHNGGSTASQTAVAAVSDYFRRLPQAADTPENALHGALAEANRRLAALLAQQPELNGMGTTLLAVLLDETDGRFTFLSVGDSPLYHCENGCLRRINANHAFAEILKILVADGQMSAEEARTHPSRHAITSAVSGGDVAAVDIGHGSLKTGESLLLASDGIHLLNENEINNLLNQHPPQQAVRALLDAAEHKGDPHQDNTSLLLISAAPAPFRLPESPPTLSQPHATPSRWGWLLPLLALIAALLWYAARQAPADTPAADTAPSPPSSPRN